MEDRIVIGNNDVLLSIHNENDIQQFTEGNFMNRFLNNWQIDGDIESHSPVNMSNENSDDECINEYENECINECDDESHMNHSNNKVLKKLSYKDVKKSIDKYYEVNEQYNELDILTTYLKGQKNIYRKSQSITQTKLHLLMIPALIGTTIISVCAPILQSYSWSGVFISGLNTLVALFISITHYFKLEPSCDLYLHLMNQYDRLENSIEFSNNRISFFDSNKDKRVYIFDRITDVEKKIGEIKETTKTILPNEIKLLFPIICNINIFSFIKRIENYKQNLINKLKDVKNETQYIEWKWETLNEKQQKRYDYLIVVKEKVKNEIFHYKNAFVAIDELFVKEIKNADAINIFNFWCNKKTVIETTNNHALQEYLSTIFIAD
jgi:hypothetical protein